MIIVDGALDARERADKPVRVAMAGAGFMGRAITRQILNHATGLRLAGIFNRTPAHAEAAFRAAGANDVCSAETADQFQTAMDNGVPAVLADPTLLSAAPGIDVVVEATGDLDFGTRVIRDAIGAGKHVISMNAEVDSSIGPILKVHADRAGVVYSNTDGDEPGVAMNLYRQIMGMGLRPVMMGQIKGFLDHYRTPDTQRDFAESVGQRPKSVASYADGSKLAMEAALMGNATGFRPAIRGMHGHRCAHVDDLLKHFSAGDVADGGLVEYVLGAAPHSGAFVVAEEDDAERRGYLQYFKMGDGPLHMFYAPFHLAHLQVTQSIARAALFGDATIAPAGAPSCDAISLAKRPLAAGDILDGPGGFDCYGLVECYEVSRREDLLPIALSEGCVLKRDVAKDQPISYADIDLPPCRECDALRAEQDAYFS